MPKNSTLVNNDNVLNRRNFLVYALAASSAASIVTLSAKPAAAATLPQNPTTFKPLHLATVQSAAAATIGTRLNQSPWVLDVKPGTRWSAQYVDWLLKDAGIPKSATPAELYNKFKAFNLTGSTPTAGAVIFYHRGSDASIYHAGFVTEVKNYAVFTAEGDVPDGSNSASNFVRKFGLPWSDKIIFGYPQYV